MSWPSILSEAYTRGHAKYRSHQVRMSDRQVQGFILCGCLGCWIVLIGIGNHRHRCSPVEVPRFHLSRHLSTSSTNGEIGSPLLPAIRLAQWRMRQSRPCSPGDGSPGHGGSPVQPINSRGPGEKTYALQSRTLQNTEVSWSLFLSNTGHNMSSVLFIDLEQNHDIMRESGTSGNSWARGAATQSAMQFWAKPVPSQNSHTMRHGFRNRIPIILAHWFWVKHINHCYPSKWFEDGMETRVPVCGVYPQISAGSWYIFPVFNGLSVRTYCHTRN